MRGNFSIVHSNFSYSDILSLPYFENWLGGFTTAEGCFSIRASGRRRAHDASSLSSAAAAYLWPPPGPPQPEPPYYVTLYPGWQYLVKILTDEQRAISRKPFLSGILRDYMPYIPVGQ